MNLQRHLSQGSASLCTYREVWTDRDRPEILQILDAPSDYAAGPIKLLIPWMDRVFTIERFGYHLAVHEAETIKRKYAAADIIRTFFPEARDEDCIQALARFLVAIKHDGYVRRGMTLVSARGDRRLEMRSYDHAQTSPAYHFEAGHITVYAAWFCRLVLLNIDEVMARAEIEAYSGPPF